MERRKQKQFRHEFKHELNCMGMLILRQRLSVIMHRDTHAVDGKYEIPSLYFDNADDKALREKTDGASIWKNTGSVFIIGILL